MSIAYADDTARHGIGGNSPPLADVLATETTAARMRADTLVESAGRAAVTGDESAGKAVLLVKMMKEHVKAIDDSRRARKEPFLDSCGWLTHISTASPACSRVPSRALAE